VRFFRLKVPFCRKPTNSPLRVTTATDPMPFFINSRVIRKLSGHEKPLRNRPHHLARFGQMPAFARQRFQIVQRQDAVKLFLLRNRECNLTVKRQDRINKLTDQYFRVD
jgi:hypothetical protein